MPNRLSEPKTWLFLAGVLLAILPMGTLHAADPAALIEAVEGPAASSPTS